MKLAWTGPVVNGFDVEGCLPSLFFSTILPRKPPGGCRRSGRLEDVLGHRHVVAPVAVAGCCCWLMAAGCRGCCYCWLTLLLLLLLLLAAGCWLLAAGYLLHGRTY